MHLTVLAMPGCPNAPVMCARAIPQHQLPRGVSGAFVHVCRARNSPRHSPSYPLDYADRRDRQHVRMGRHPWEGHRVPDWCRTPSRRSI